ncbi:MAG: CapA family protein [Deltaproteobacteria bacterium]|nr:CapA family protein [Deltaproteobacteria bacterium]
MLALLILSALHADPLEDGRALLRAKDAAGAERVLAACTAADPQNVDCWWELGWARWLARDWDGTVQAWERVRALDPGRPDLDARLAAARDAAAVTAMAHAARDAAPESFRSSAPEGATLRFRAVGDVMLGTDFPAGCLPPEDGAEMLRSVSSLLRDADLTFANLEGPLCDAGSTHKCSPDKPEGSCYAFRTPTRYGRFLVDAGIDVVSTANNHSGDFGETCRVATERTLDALGIAHSGRAGDVASIEVNGLKVAVLGFHASAATHDVRDPATAADLVRGLRARHDLVIVSFHGGAEGSKAIRTPTGPETYYGENRGDVRAFARAVVDAGADLVVGHGPHVLRGMEIYKDRLVAYSLGNFATYGRFNVTGNQGVGAVLEVVLDREGRFRSGRLLPTRQIGEGIPQPDPDGRALDLVRTLSSQDFPGTAVRVALDGTLGAP